MKLFRFSPIDSEEQLFAAIQYLHKTCHELSKQSLGKYNSVSGSVGIFCHYEDEYNYLLTLRDDLTMREDNFNNKYFKLRNPITIEKDGEIPAATYEYLYIRQPDVYRSQVGDVDFVLDKTSFDNLKLSLEDKQIYKGARIQPLSTNNLGMIELIDPDKDVLSYLVTEPMSEKFGS